MKLYYSPGACSLAPHIVLNEIGATFQPEKVDLRAKTYSGGDYRKVNPKGSVPVIGLPSGENLTENAVILQYLADHKPEAKLLPPAGAMARYRTLEMLNFITTDIHKTYSILFAAGRMVSQPEGLDQLKRAARETLTAKYEVVAKALENSEYLMGPGFSLPDAYLYVVTRWSKMLEVDLSKYPAIAKFMTRMESRPAVQKSLKEEGLSPF